MDTVKQNNEREDINGQNTSNKPFRGIHIKISPTDASHGIIITEGVTYFEVYGVLKVLLTKLENTLGISK